MENRIIDLEIRITHLEDTIEVLNETIIKQKQDYDNLLLQVEILEKRVKSMQESHIARESEETPPPHY